MNRLRPAASIAVLAAVGLSLLVFYGCTRTQVSRRGAERREDSQLASARMSAARLDVQRRAGAALAAIVQAAASEHGFSELARHLSGAPIGSLVTVGASDDAELDGAIQRFQVMWKQLYGRPFYLLDHAQPAFSEGVHVLDSADQARLSEAELIHIELQPLQGAPAVRAVMREDPDGSYRLVLPRGVTATQLKSRIAQALDALTGERRVWPENAREAERIAAQRLLAAIAGAAQGGD